MYTSDKQIWNTAQNGTVLHVSETNTTQYTTEACFAYFYIFALLLLYDAC